MTFTVLFCSAWETVTNKNTVSIFGRRISDDSIKKALAVAFIFAVICAGSVLCLSAVTGAPLLDVVYEAVSATATVGLSRSLTMNLNTVGKFIVIATMYFGRVGPISLAVAFGRKNESQNVISDPIEEISVG